MPYGRQTSKYQIRSPRLGEIIDSSEEKRNANIVENQMFGGIRTHSGGHGILRNGAFVITGTGPTYNIVLVKDPANGKPVFEGFIGQIYCYTDTALMWTGLPNTQVSYLYVRLVEAGDTNSSRSLMLVQPSSNTSGVIPSDGVLVAAVIMDEPSNSVVVEDPIGRIDIPVLGDHIVDFQNPHTTVLLQNELVVSGLRALDYVYFDELRVRNLIVSGNSQVISGNMIVLGNTVFSGNVFVNGTIQYQNLLVQNANIPGTLIVSGLQVASGLDVYSTSLFRNNMQLASGITIDGFDPSVGIPLLDGSNADHLHTHVLGNLALGVKPIQFSPEYKNTVVSGNSNGVFLAQRAFNNNYYTWYPLTSGVSTPVTRIRLPQDFESISKIDIDNGVGSLLSGSKIEVFVFDKDGTATTLTNGVLQNTTITTTSVLVSGGNFLPSTPMTIQNRMYSASGIGTFLGDMTFWYQPKNGERLTFDWNKTGVITSTEENFDGLRVAPFDLRIEKVVVGQSLALSGSSVFDINVGAAGSAPVGVLTTKPTLSFGATGASYQETELKVINTSISAGSIVTASIDQIASGSLNATVQLVTYRI